ncbi:MAG: hypothetical protein D6723_10450 [Acidobacteria bacterium]|nr:MAG: hypothetical protein D6723_10450 [Acidobacteriota bacterium]
MRRILLMNLVFAVLFLSGVGEAMVSTFSSISRVEMVGAFTAVTDTRLATAMAAQSQPQPVPDATYAVKGDVRYVQIPITDCVNVTATPIVVGDWMIYPMHTHQRQCQTRGPYDRTLLGFNARDGQLYEIYGGAAGEAPLTYVSEANTLYWDVGFGGSVLRLDAETLAFKDKIGVRATSDSSGVFLDGLYYYGTVNSPFSNCQQPVNPDCGGVFALDAEGNVSYSLNLDKGFRAWIGTGLTTDGEFLYIGTAAQTVGEKSGDETEYLYGCSVVKADKQLNIVASFDPGDLGCYMLPFQGANMDSVAGEIPIGPNELWVQYVRPNDSGMRTALYILEKEDLSERCHLEFDFEPRTQAVGFYAAPTLDAEGNAYVPVTVPDATAVRKAQLFKVTPRCQSTLLMEVPESWAHASPTLADDQYVLFATDGRLHILTLDGQLVRQYELGSDARVLTSPVLHNGAIYVLQEDGTLNIIENSGLEGYGKAIWPRYRHDNLGSGSLLNQRATEPPPGDEDEGEKSTQLAGAFVAVHLEVSTRQHIAQLWPQLERLIALADEYGEKLTLMFTAHWARYVLENDLLNEVHAWERAGHEIALHHHGPSHAFFDGYTNRPDLIQDPSAYRFRTTYQGTMDDLLKMMAPLSERGIVSAGMTDQEYDWHPQLRYQATKSDPEAGPSPDDLLSVPHRVKYNDMPAIEVFNTGYAIGRLEGSGAVTLEDVERALETATAEQVMGLVLNDDTLQNRRFEDVQELFEVLESYGVRVQTMRELLMEFSESGLARASCMDSVLPASWEEGDEASSDLDTSRKTRAGRAFHG